MAVDVYGLPIDFEITGGMLYKILRFAQDDSNDSLRMIAMIRSG
jgi:hypothetical protein